MFKFWESEDLLTSTTFHAESGICIQYSLQHCGVNLQWKLKLESEGSLHICDTANGIEGLVTEIKSRNITFSKSCEMDTKLVIQIKEEESILDNVASQNETEFFHKIVTMKRKCDTVPLDDHCDMPVKTEMKSEAPFIKHLAKQIKSEAITCGDNRKIKQATPITDFDSQSKGEPLPEDHVKKLGKFNSGHETCIKIEIKEKPLCLEAETSAMCDDIKGGDFTPVKSSSDKSSLTPARVTGSDTSCYSGKDHLECELQKSDVTEMPTAEKHVLSQQSGKCSEVKEICIRSLLLKQKTLSHQDKRAHKCKTCDKSYTQLSHLERHNFIHEGKKPHKCNSCDSFTLLSNLKTHNLIHECEKPYQCTSCGTSFSHL